MKSLPSAILLLLLFLVVAQQSWSRPLQPNDVVSDTCRPMPFPDFCVSTLRSDPKSASAKGSKDLGVILIDQIDSKAKPALRKIKSLIPRAKEPKLKSALSFCHDIYHAIVTAFLSASRGALISGNPKFAEDYMSDTAREMTWCNEKFDGLESPLTRENDFVQKAASIVAAIARTMEL